jgi:hypothetical protein
MAKVDACMLPAFQWPSTSLGAEVIFIGIYFESVHFAAYSWALMLATRHLCFAHLFTDEFTLNFDV